MKSAGQRKIRAEPRGSACEEGTIDRQPGGVAELWIGAFGRRVSQAIPTADRARFALKSKVFAGVEAVLI
jgi:hypothetical protein